MTDSITLSNTLSKIGTDEEMSMVQAAMDDASSRLKDEIRLAAISNEQIGKGEPILDTYEVLSDPIHGGMGSVWRVHHKNWNVDLAMKRPQPRYFAEGDASRKEEFIRECEYWIDLGLHPHIVSCYYVREIGGVPTIFSEWMDGGSLKDRIRDGALYAGSESEVQQRILDIAIQAARGLEYAHACGLVHQDMKPGNLLLTKGWDARLADFGLARAQSRLADGDVRAFTGYTLQYCPKEQTEGDTPERWMDIYAWALTVLEMYAGERRWKSGEEGRDRFEELALHCRVPLPEEVLRVLEDALNNRPDSISAILDDLTEIYQKTTGILYARPKASAAADTSDALNNRALSFLDMGKSAMAEKIWNEAIRMDYSNFRCHYNLAVALWQSNRISAEELRKRILAQKEDSDLYRTAEQDTEFAELKTANSIQYKIWTSNVQQPLPEEPYHDVLRYRMGDVREGYCTSDYECPLNQGDLYLDDSLDGKRRLGIDAEGKRYFLEEEGIRRYFRTCLESEYVPERNNLTVKRFTDAKGQIVVDHSGYAVNFFNAETGRSLLNYHLKKDSEGDEIFERVFRYSENGFAYLAEYNRTRGWWMKLPPADPQLSYSLSRIASFAERQESLKKLAEILPEAEKAYEDGEHGRCLEALKPFAEDGSLLLYEPAELLWHKLFAWFEPVKMITVLTEDPAEAEDGRWLSGGGDPDEPDGEYTEGKAEDAYAVLTSSYTEYTKENYNNSMDVTLFYTVHAQDAVTGRPFYTFSFTENERDDVIFSYNEWFKLRGQYVWMKKPEEKKPWNIDLADPVMQERMHVQLYLPGGYTLRNENGKVHIGDYVFDDVYEGLDLLSDQPVIRCRKHRYRLVYQYGEPREKETGLWKKYVLENPAVPEVKEDSAPLENNEIHPGDILDGGYTVEGGPMYWKYGCKRHVRSKDNIPLIMYRYDPSNFVEGGGLRTEEIMEGAERWVRAGKHENIVECHEARMIGGCPALFCEETDMKSVREKMTDGSLYAGSPREIRKRITAIALDLTDALQYAHRKRLTHNNITADTVVITADGKAMLDRFGMSCSAPNPHVHDVYDLALTILEMYAGKSLTGADAGRNFDAVIAACRDLPSEGMQKMLRLCLKYEISDIGYVRQNCEKELRKAEEDTDEPAPAKRGFFARMAAKKDCNKGNHDWYGCVCTVCGQTRHDYVMIEEKEIPNGGCKWSVSDPCTGPNCGTPCDSYYPGREGKTVRTYRCRRCGHIRTDE